MREIQFTPLAKSQVDEWKSSNKKIYSRIEKLIDSIKSSSFNGIGKPEPLKHELAGYWSRRITKEHRLVYQVTADAIIVISCKYHY